jgi:penicillin-binding protein 1A
MAIWASLLCVFFVLWFGSDLPDIGDLTKLSRQRSVTITDKHGAVLATYGDLYGNPIHAKELPKHVIHALLAIEDRNFYSHMGIDPKGLVRALIMNLRKSRVVQGGSTVTQQLAKNFLQSKGLFTYDDRSLRRKLVEVLLTLKIERRFSKEQILTMHLNRVYMGSGTWGIDAAAKKYFGKSAKALSLYDAAILMGLLKGPSRYAPTANHERSEVRAQQVLMAMVESGFITQDMAEVAMLRPTPLATGTRKHSARYFTDWVMDQLKDIVDASGQDIAVTTTLDLTAQRIAEKYAHDVMASRGKVVKASQMALVSMDKTGAVQAMIGGMNYTSQSFNRAVKAVRQAGSTFKYFVYLAALEQGASPGDRYSDRERSFGGWRPKNYRYKAVGSIALRDAFAKSVNAVSAQLISNLGPRKVIAMARRLGISTPIPSDLTIALGSCGVSLIELTSAFGVTLAEGRAIPAYGIIQVRSRGGDILYQHKPSPVDEQEALDQETVDEMKTLLKAVVDYGSGRYVRIPDIPIMGKTGTSNLGRKDRDLWFVGLTSKHVTGVWTGNDDGTGMIPVKGGSPSLHLYKAFTQGLELYQKNPKAPAWQDEALACLPAYDCAPNSSQIKEALEQDGQKDREKDRGQDEEDDSGPDEGDDEDEENGQEEDEGEDGDDDEPEEEDEEA